MSGDLENTYSAIFGKTLSAFWRNRSVIFEKIVQRFWRKPFGDFGENRLALALEIWRNLFGEIVVGELEKLFGDFILEIIMEYCDARRLYVVIK